MQVLSHSLAFPAEAALQLRADSSSSALPRAPGARPMVCPRPEAPRDKPAGAALGWSLSCCRPLLGRPSPARPHPDPQSQPRSLQLAPTPPNSPRGAASPPRSRLRSLPRPRLLAYRDADALRWPVEAPCARDAGPAPHCRSRPGRARAVSARQTASLPSP